MAYLELVVNYTFFFLWFEKCQNIFLRSVLLISKIFCVKGEIWSNLEQLWIIVLSKFVFESNDWLLLEFRVKDKIIEKWIIIMKL